MRLQSAKGLHLVLPMSEAFQDHRPQGTGGDLKMINYLCSA
jgi:hypothetical protein